MPRKGVPTLSESPPRVRVTGVELSRAPKISTPPATWAARPAGIAKYDRAPERPIKRRRWFISDSTEEVGPVSGIRRTSPCHFVNLRNSMRLSHDRYFPDCWVVTFLGQIVRSEERSGLPGYDEKTAARSATATVTSGPETECQ